MADLKASLCGELPNQESAIPKEKLRSLLERRGIVSDPDIPNAKARLAEQELRRNMYHNTQVMLKHYRDIVWALECFPSEVAQELDQPLKDLDALLSVVDTQVALGNAKLEHRLLSIRKSRLLLDRINEALTVLRHKPGNGELMYMVLFFQSSMAELGIEVKTNPIDLMAFMQQVFMEDNYEMTAYMSYWFPYDPYTFVANMYPSTDYTDPSGIYSTDPQVAKALANMSDTESKELIGGLYNTDDPTVVQEIYTAALDCANESSVVIPLNYRNEYAVFNSEVIESYTFNSIPNHVDVAAIQLR